MESLKHLRKILNNVYGLSYLEPVSIWNESKDIGILFEDSRDGPGEKTRIWFNIFFNDNGITAYTCGNNHTETNRGDCHIPEELVELIRNYRRKYFHG